MSVGSPFPTRPETRPTVRLLVGGAIAVGLALVSTHSFLLFHSLAELFAVVIGSALFLIAWNSRRIASNDFLLFLGIGYLAVSLIDALHLLAFPGLNVLGEGRGLSSQLWLAARAIEASALLIAPVYLRRRVRTSFAFTGFAVATAALLATAFGGWFPRTVAGDALTPFKSISEVVIALAFSGAMFLLWRRRGDVDASVLHYVMASIALRVASELSLVVYSDPYGIASFIGHLLKVTATYLLYKGLIENLLMRPYVTLFKSMKEHEEQLNEAVGELESFSHSVSHDLRAPLTAVTGFGELLLHHGTRLDDAEREYATQIVSGAHRMAEIVDGLMRLTNLSRDEIEIGPVDVSSLCADVADTLRRTDPDRSIEISIEPGLYADGDPRLLRSALENLLGNAWKFTSKTADPRIAVGMQEGSGTGPVLYVRDNGAGFESAKAGNLFTAFSRLHDQSDFAGTGVGLATVQRIVRRHGGSVWAEGEVGRGATFYLRLPQLHRKASGPQH